MREEFRRGSLLRQAAILTALLFITAAVVNGISIFGCVRSNYMSMLRKDTENVLGYVRSTMTDYKSLPWLVAFWHENDQSLELSGDASVRTRRIGRMVQKYGFSSLRDVSPEEAEAFDDEEKRVFAEYCYMELDSLFDSVSGSFGAASFTCAAMPDREGIVPLFLGSAEGGLDAHGREYALGEDWSFDISLHPAVREMYQMKEDRSYFETVTSTADGTEYLYGYLPILADGEICCHICASFAMTDLYRNVTGDIRTIEIVNAILLSLSGAALLVLLNRLVLRPMALIQRSVRQYRDRKDSGAVCADLLRLQSRDEVGRLAADISALAVELDRYTSEVGRLSAEKERLDAELKVASRIQADILPRITPQFPGRTEFDISAAMFPAKGIGGDFYDLFMIDHNRIAILVGDVSGKGIPAALFMVVVKTLLKNRARAGGGPGEVLRVVNNQLCESNEAKMFATVWLGILHIPTRHLVCASAAHEASFVYRSAEGRFTQEQESGGLPLALRYEQHFQETHLDMAGGDALFLYTDGVTRAANGAREPFGKERTEDALNDCAKRHPEEILKGVRRQIEGFMGDAPQTDDMTMLCLRFR